MSELLNCYCAFCRLPRKLYRKKGLSAANYLQSFGVGVILSLIFWQQIVPQALIFVIASLMLTEISILFRRRMEINCPHCGFDPHLYAKNKEAACEKVKIHLKGRQDDPDVWLARKPAIHLPSRPQNPSRQKPKSTREIVV